MHGGAAALPVEAHAPPPPSRPSILFNINRTAAHKKQARTGMSDSEDKAAAEEAGGDDQIATQMKEKDEYLARRLRLSRIFVRTLDVGFGYPCGQYLC
jgi:hypothetical protein